MNFIELEGINPKKVKTILTPTKGSLKAYSHSINPYSGCLLDCSYCYVPNGFHLTFGDWAKENWGKWVHPKLNASFLLKNELHRKKERLSKITVFLGSVTDPYQPIEKKYKITKSVLEVFLQYPIHYLTIQTRSPLIIRDLNLLKQLHRRLQGRLNVNMTITSNIESIRKKFEPNSASYYSRKLVLKKLTGEGLNTTATVSPVLPCNPQTFANQITDVTKKVSFEPIIIEPNLNEEKMRTYIGALTRENFYKILPKEMEKYFTKKFYEKVVETFIQTLGKERVIDRASLKNEISHKKSHMQNRKRLESKQLAQFF